MGVGSFYLSPNGKPVYLPASVTKTCFVEDNIDCPRGALKEFIFENQRYYIDIPTDQFSGTPTSLPFGGYRNKNKKYYNDNKTYVADQIIKARKGYLFGECLVTIEEGDYKIKASYPNSTISDDELNKNFSAAKTISLNQPCQSCLETSTTSISSLADYSTGSNGKSFLTQTEKDKLKEQLNALSKALGGKYKIYLIDKTNAKADEAREKAGKEPAGTAGTVEYDGTTSSIEVKLDFKFPAWFSDFTVNADCGRTIVAQAIEELHNNTAYKNGTTLDKILLEIGVSTYKGFWAYVQCTFGEEASKNNGPTAQYVAGATFEFISIFNVEELLKGIYQLGKGSVTLVSDSYIAYFKDLASIYKDAKAGKYNELTPDNVLILLNKLSPPQMRAYDAAIKQICNVSKTLFNYYVDDVPTKYWRYGQLTIIVVPVILTAGEWAAAKGVTITAELTAKYGAKAKEVATIIAKADDAAVIASDATKITVNAEKEIITIEKAGKETTITRTAKAGDNLLTTEGKFIDNVLETDYQKYLARKTSQGKVPRERLDWKEARDYWLYDSPMARGNAFNKTAVDNDWYTYNEVTLANGKRVDGYTPPTNGKPGEIVSRKATNLEEIELSTFEGYLKEMKTKYPVGEPINAPKYGNELKGKALEGNQILEIPSSNQSFSQIQDYVDLAKNKYNIEIRFKPE
jgi:hypothetical protein